MMIGVLPAEHLHASAAGHSIVHRHVANDIDGHHAAFDDSHVDIDHHHEATTVDRSTSRPAQTLERAFVSQRQFDLKSPAIAPALMVPHSDTRVPGRVELLVGPTAHGPPHRVGTDRAPPA